MKNRIAAICNSNEIVDLYVFGSRADEIAGLFRDGAGPLSGSGSDVDIGVLPEKREPWRPERRVKVSMALEDLFQVSRVDLVILPEADPYLALDIIRGELLYTSDPDRQARYELFVLRRAADLLPFKKEYKEIGPRLTDEGILSEDQGRLLRQIAGYRNRMVHFYHEVTREELFRLCTTNLKDLEDILGALVEWLRANPDRMDQQI